MNLDQIKQAIRTGRANLSDEGRSNLLRATWTQFGVSLRGSYRDLRYILTRVNASTLAVYISTESGEGGGCIHIAH